MELLYKIWKRGGMLMPIRRVVNALTQAIDSVISGASDATGRGVMRAFQGLHVAGKRLFRRGNADERLERNRSRRNAQNNPHMNDVPFMMQRGFIHGQRLAPQCDLEIGDTGNGGDNGCGPIALYNAMFALDGHAPDLAEIIYALERDGGFNLGGLAGTNPEALVSYLRGMGRQADISYLPRNLDTSIETAGASIFLYSGGRTYIHYVMIRHVPATGSNPAEFLIYNRGSRDQGPISTPSVEQWAATGIDDRSYTSLALITIPR
jgi:hypothetical protein